ncbi:MAG: RNA-binding protein, partial [Methanomassiliicoccaceae archaeon]|nr:RNA-binding protein [Methanomassiliicoccaceae archaeon]
MERKHAGPAREVVVPGELLDDSGLRAGNGAYMLDGKIYASRLGVKNVFSGTVGVIPLRGRYIPA